MASGWAVRSLLAAAFSFSLMALFARLVGPRLSSFEIVFFRALVTLVLSAVLLRRLALPHPLGRREHRWLLVLRGVFGFAALSCFFYSVTHLPLADATVIQFTSPIFTALVAAIYLGERATPRLWGAIALGLAGVLLITRPAVLFAAHPSPLPLPVVWVGLAGAFLTSCARVLVRRLAPHEHELVIVLFFTLIAVPAALGAAASSWVWPRSWEWAFLLAVGIAGQGGQIYMTRGLQHLTAAGASVILYLQIVLATGWGVLILGERPDGWTAAGSFLVLGGTLLSARRPRLPG